ncbi:uncharacterized protein RAG0_07401 [Rhynchosporium agropyri]|uniref:Uncharacterized protein n=1 Tax=Rhynchosporium agropyri TaxID=914238 RepID=A0A1E1KLG2_9HELO|nr:uncharacterized protein RAG0_07401 [Rhynchosporium agropyri]
MWWATQAAKLLNVPVDAQIQDMRAFPPAILKSIIWLCKFSRDIILCRVIRLVHEGFTMRKSNRAAGFGREKSERLVEPHLQGSAVHVGCESPLFMHPDALSSSTMTSFYIQSRTNNCGPLSMGDPRTHLFVQIDATNLTDSCKLFINGHSTTTGMFPLFQKEFVPPPFPKYWSSETFLVQLGGSNAVKLSPSGVTEYHYWCHIVFDPQFKSGTFVLDQSLAITKNGTEAMGSRSWQFETSIQEGLALPRRECVGLN